MSEEQTRDDGPYENVFLNVGNKGDRSAYTRAVTPRLLQYTELEGLYEGDGFARRIVDLPAEEMVRAETTDPAIYCSPPPYTESFRVSPFSSPFLSKSIIQGGYVLIYNIRFKLPKFAWQ